MKAFLRIETEGMQTNGLNDEPVSDGGRSNCGRWWWGDGDSKFSL